MDIEKNPISTGCFSCIKGFSSSEFIRIGVSNSLNFIFRYFFFFFDFPYKSISYTAIHIVIEKDKAQTKRKKVSQAGQANFIAGITLIDLATDWPSEKVNAPSVCQESPFHCAILFAVDPPALVKLN